MGGFELGESDESDLAAQVPVVEPVDGLGDGDFDVGDAFRAASGSGGRVTDQLALGEGIAVVRRVTVSDDPLFVAGSWAGGETPLRAAGWMRHDSRMGNAESIISALMDRLPGEISAERRESALSQLGWALVAEGQIFLQANSSEHDVDLFFESYGYPRREDPTLWVDRIMTGLQHRLSTDQLTDIEGRALRRAEAKIVNDGAT